MDHSPLTPEHELIIQDYESYLKRWSYSSIPYRLAVARDFLHGWEEPVSQLKPTDWTAYGEDRPPTRALMLVSLQRFLEETGQLAGRRRADPAERSLTEVAEGSACWVSAYLRARKRKGQALAGREMERYNLKYFLQTLPEERGGDLSCVTASDVEGFIEHQQDRGLKATSINRRLASVRNFFTWLQEQGGYSGDNPVRRDHYLQQDDPLPRAMREEDVAALLAVIEDVMDRALYLVLLRSGIRVGELLALTVADVDLTQATLRIRQGGKNSRGRIVYLAEDAQTALDAWLQARQVSRVATVFFTQASHGLTAQTVHARFKRYLAHAGIERSYRVHDLRHTFATALLNAEVPITTLQALLGHKTLSITQRYARVSDVTKRTQYFAAMQHLQHAGTTWLQPDTEVTDDTATG